MRVAARSFTNRSAASSESGSLLPVTARRRRRSALRHFSAPRRVPAVSRSCAMFPSSRGRDRARAAGSDSTIKWSLPNLLRRSPSPARPTSACADARRHAARVAPSRAAACAAIGFRRPCVIHQPPYSTRSRAARIDRYHAVVSLQQQITSAHLTQHPAPAPRRTACGSAKSGSPAGRWRHGAGLHRAGERHGGGGARQLAAAEPARIVEGARRSFRHQRSQRDVLCVAYLVAPPLSYRPEERLRARCSVAGACCRSPR